MGMIFSIFEQSKTGGYVENPVNFRHALTGAFRRGGYYLPVCSKFAIYFKFANLSQTRNSIKLQL